jgi:Family of unknown function (DUF6519)
MKGDFSRIRFNPAKQYTAVLEQQGRVALDADANEQCEIDAHLRETGAAGTRHGSRDLPGQAREMKRDLRICTPGNTIPLPALAGRLSAQTYQSR